MTRRFKGLGSLIAFPFVLAATVAFAALGAATDPTSNPATPAPMPTSPAGYWQQQLDDSRVSLEANTTALHAAPLTGQPISRLTRQCQAAVASFNAAAAHLSLDPINPSKECTP